MSAYYDEALRPRDPVAERDRRAETRRGQYKEMKLAPRLINTLSAKWDPTGFAGRLKSNSTRFQYAQ